MRGLLQPLIGIYIYGNGSANEGEKLDSLMLPYLAIGFVVLAVAILFMITHLPEIKDEEVDSGIPSTTFSNKPLIKQRHLVLGVIAQFAYVAAQTGVFSYLINFITDEKQQPHFDKSYGPYFLSIGFALFMTGRMSGSYLMSFIKPAKLLALYALACCLLLPIVGESFG